MEAAATAAAGGVARRGLFCPGDAGPFRRVVGTARCAGSGRVSVRRPGGFADEGHLRYYAPSARCGGREEEKRVAKTRAKLVKELAVFQAAAGAGGLGVEGATGERRITLEEAADVLLARLELMRAEEKEMKRRRKEEKKAAMRAASKQKGGCDDDDSEDSEDEQEGKKRDDRMREMKTKKKQDEKAATLKAACKKKMKDCDESESSSSSSESSDSDCEEEAMDMDSLRTTVPANAEPVVPEDVQVEIITAKEEELSSPAAESRSGEEGAMAVGVAQMLVGPGASASACCSNGKYSVPAMAAEAGAAAAAAVERIEVCMGGKCKKAGAAELMRAFEGRLGVGGGAVVGCKCMGKCREGPNVRIRNVAEGDEGDQSVKAVRNPLCLGVGLDDVGAIVAKFFGEEIIQVEEVGLSAA